MRQYLCLREVRILKEDNVESLNHKLTFNDKNNEKCSDRENKKTHKKDKGKLNWKIKLFY